MRNILTISLIIASSFLTATGQSQLPTRQTDSIAEKFVSMEGGFSVSRPPLSDDRTDPMYLFMLDRDDGSFTWKNGKRAVQVICSNWIFAPSDAKKILNSYIDTSRASSPKNQNKKEFKSHENPGIELRFDYDGMEVVNRYIMGKNRFCTLYSSWPKGEAGTEQIKVLDSFEFVDNTAFNKKRLEDATPTLLPQTPMKVRPISDAKTESLKGKVKSVTEYGGVVTNPLVKEIRSQNSYDPNGNHLKQLTFDYQGNPSIVTVYGFIDGKRVSKQGFIEHGYDPPPPKAARPNSSKPQSQTPPDTRYGYSYESKYDDQGRVTVENLFSNTGRLISKTLYAHLENTVEQSSFNGEGKATSKTVKHYDNIGNLIEADYISTSPNYGDGNHKFTYEGFDKHGNWTKRIVNGKTAVWGGGQKEFQSIDYRVIAYY